jgi:hypothetical protein
MQRTEIELPTLTKSRTDIAELHLKKLLRLIELPNSTLLVVDIWHPIRDSPEIDNDDPRREHARKDKDDPQQAKFSTLIDEPNFEKLRVLKELPRVA